MRSEDGEFNLDLDFMCLGIFPVEKSSALGVLACG